MNSDDKPGDDYVRRVYDGTRRFTQDLLAENERLRALVATLQHDKLLLQQDVLGAREELERFRREQARIEHSLATVEAENRDYSARYVEVETHNYNLMNLYVATLRLHGTLVRDEVLEISKDIVVNLLGCEELALFELGADGSALELVASAGIDAHVWARVPLGQGAIGRAATGLEFAGGDDAPGRGTGEELLTACVPLRRLGQVVGALAVFRLLPHKVGLQSFDHELLRLLGSQVAMALHAASTPGHASA